MCNSYLNQDYQLHHKIENTSFQLSVCEYALTVSTSES